MQGVLQASHWTSTPCVIQSSTVVTKGSGKKQNFYPEILYSYSLNKTRYEAARWNPFSSNTKSRADTQRIVRRFPARTSAQCYVNPANPAQAVLDRSIPNSARFALLTLIFVAVGTGAIVWQIVSLRAEKTNQPREQSSWQPNLVLLLGAGPNLVLKPVASHTSKCLILAIFAMLWNAFIITFF